MAEPKTCDSIGCLAAPVKDISVVDMKSGRMGQISLCQPCAETFEARAAERMARQVVN